MIYLSFYLISPGFVLRVTILQRIVEYHKCKHRLMLHIARKHSKTLPYEKTMNIYVNLFHFHTIMRI